MADCSKTEVFLAEWERACIYCGRNCDECDIASNSLCSFIPPDFRRLQDAVQKWSDEHPLPKLKTYADVFFEKFPNAVKRGKQYGNLPMTCRDYIFGTGCPFHGRGSDSLEEANRKCADCWNEPYPEQENRN